MERKSMKIKHLIILWVIMALSGFVSSGIVAVAGPVPDTGQTKCYNDSGEIPCPESGADFYGQDATYTINPHSYTKLDATGNDLPDGAGSWVMVRDNVTGLVWEVKQAKDETADYGNPHDADNKYTWYDSNSATNGGNAGTPGDGTDTEDFIAALNGASFGGFLDWRMPTRKELRTIVDYNRYNPSIDPAFFPHTQSSRYWSATTSAYSPDRAWCMYFDYGYDNSYVKSNSYYVRAVRGGQ